MRKIISAFCLVGGVSLFLMSCDQNESMVVDEPVVPNGRIAFDSISLSQASLGVSRLIFQLQDSTDNESDSTEVESDSLDAGIQVEGPFNFDLLAGTTTPTFDIAPGVYETIVIKSAPVLPDTNSIFLAFGATDGANTYTVEFSSITPRSFVIQGDSAGFQFDGTVSQILVLLNVDALFEGIDLSKATVDEDGVIRINKTSNTRLYNKINSNIGKAFKADEEDD